MLFEACEKCGGMHDANKQELNAINVNENGVLRTRKLCQKCCQRLNEASNESRLLTENL